MCSELWQNNTNQPLSYTYLCKKIAVFYIFYLFLKIGAVDILRNVDDIDFKVLMSGKICYDEIQRVKKLARLNCIQMPAFMRNQEKYKKTLKQIAHMNGLHLDHAKFKAPMAYLRRLKRGRRIGVAGGSKKVRKSERKGSLSSNLGSGNEGSTGNGGVDNSKSDYEEAGFFFQDCSGEINNELGNTAGENFYETMKKQMEKEETSKETNESHSVSYHESLVNDKEKLELGKEEEDKNTEKSRKTNDRLKDLDWEQDCQQSAYRCVSRASVQSILNLPSKSLNSRNKNSNAGCSLSSTPSLNSLRPLSTNSLSIRRTSSTASFEGNQKSEESIDDPKKSKYSVSKALPPATPIWSPSTCTVQYANVNQTLSGQNKLQQSQSMNQAHQHANSVKMEADGFIYPETDILTDDMIKIQSGLQSLEMENQQASPNCTTSQVKLLNRRVKSAANLLPKFPA